MRFIQHRACFLLGYTLKQTLEYLYIQLYHVYVLYHGTVYTYKYVSRTWSIYSG